MIDEDLARWLFMYHAPRGDQGVKYIRIREAALVFAQTILKETPASPDQSVAIRCVREAVMWANSSIANEGRG